MLHAVISRESSRELIIRICTFAIYLFAIDLQNKKKKKDKKEKKKSK